MLERGPFSSKSKIEITIKIQQNIEKKKQAKSLKGITSCNNHMNRK